jgi:hypothetical protein
MVEQGLRWLADRASRDSFFLGEVLAEYEAIEGIDDHQLAIELQCSPEVLARLALCRRPDDQEGKFREDIHRIAAYASCNADALARLLREVAAVKSLREEVVESSRRLMMAARDRKKKGGLLRKEKPASKKRQMK